MTDLMNIFILGLLYGFTVCSFSCMPYLAPYTIGAGGGFREGVRGSLVFVTGKIFTYSLMGGIAAYLGNALITINSDTVSYLFGTVLVAVGLSMMLKKKKGSCSDNRIKMKIIRQCSGRLPLFILGVMTSLLPCLPLSALFLMAADSGIIYKGAAYGLLFGSGLIISPIILAGGFLGFISGRLGIEMPDMKSFMRACSAVMMIFMGAVEFFKGFYF